MNRPGLLQDKRDEDNDEREDPLLHPSPPHQRRGRRSTTTDDASSTRLKLTISDAQLRAALDRFGQQDENENENDWEGGRKGGGVTVTNNNNDAVGGGVATTSTTATEATTTEASSAFAASSSVYTVIPGAVACLCSATLGAGILSLPFAMAQAGILAGMGLLLVSALATGLSIDYLVQAMHVMNNNNENNNHNHNPREATYEEVVEVCVGPRARTLVEASMLLFCGGGAVAYIIAVGDILQQSEWATNQASSRALAMALVWACAMLPLSLLRTMKSLQCTSSIGIASVATLVLAALFHYLEYYHENHTNNDESDNGNDTDDDNDNHHNDTQSILFPMGGFLSIVRACPIILFAFSCQVNVCAIFEELPGAIPTISSSEQEQEQQQRLPEQAPIDEEMILSRNSNSSRNRNSNSNNNQHNDDTTTNNNNTHLQQQQQQHQKSKLQRMTAVTWIAVAICAGLYASISVITLLDFGSTNMTPNILSKYNPESIMQVAFVGMTVAVVLAYPMNIFPARVTLLGIVQQWKVKRRQQQTRQRTTGQQQTSPQQHCTHHNTNNVNDNDNNLTEPLLSEPNNTAMTVDLEVTPQQEVAGAGAGAGNLAQQNNPNDNENVNGNTDNNNNDDDDSLLEHVLATLFLTGFSLGLAVVAPNISVVFGLLGGTSSSVLGFVIPGLLGYYTAEEYYNNNDHLLGHGQDHQDQDAATGIAAKIQRTKVWSRTLVIGGIVVGILTTGVTIYSTFADPK